MTRIVIAACIAVAAPSIALAQTDRLHVCSGTTGFTFVHPGGTCPSGQSLYELPLTGGVSPLGFKVVDSQNQTVGTLFGATGSVLGFSFASVAFESGGRLFAAVVTRTGIRGESVWFTSADCTGQVYVTEALASSEDLLPKIAVSRRANGFDVYLADTSSPSEPQSRQIRSRRDYTATSCVPFDTTTTVYPTLTAIPINVVPPFTIIRQ
jgi:hypothetical protein